MLTFWALAEDLHQRGLDKDVSVVVWASSAGRRGSTPRRAATTGRL